MSKEAVIVLGPEGSGTRFLTSCFVACGYYGSGEHSQPFKGFDFSNKPDKIVFRQSVPHAKHWLRYKSFAPLIEAEGYTIKPIVILRDQVFTARSQVRSGYVKSRSHAQKRIRQAKAEIFKAAPLADIVIYESLVEDPAYRAALFSKWGIEPVGIEYKNGNKKYQK